MLSRIVDRQTSALEDGYPWSKLGEKKVVDVGGGSGHVSIALAQVNIAVHTTGFHIFQLIMR